MMLAFAEIRRGRGRFASIIAALSLIVFLVLTLGALADGLFFGATGAVRSTNATAYAFSPDAKGSLIRSSMSPRRWTRCGMPRRRAGHRWVGVLLTAGQTPDAEYDVAIFESTRKVRACRPRCPKGVCRNPARTVPRRWIRV